MSTTIQTRIPKPAGVPSGTTKTMSRDFTGGWSCIGCGRKITRAACRGHVNGRWVDVGHVDPTQECCVGMLIVTATWDNAGHGFPRVMFDNGNGTSTAEWAVCPTCVVGVDA